MPIEYYPSGNKVLFQISIITMFLFVLIGVILFNSFLDYSTITGMVISTGVRENISIGSNLALGLIVVLIIVYILSRMFRGEAE